MYDVPTTAIKNFEVVNQDWCLLWKGLQHINITVSPHGSGHVTHDLLCTNLIWFWNTIHVVPCMEMILFIYILNILSNLTPEVQDTLKCFIDYFLYNIA